jgi:hypothetical protein
MSEFDIIIPVYNKGKNIITVMETLCSSVNDVAISVRNVSKMYRLYAQPSDRLKQSLWYALPKFLRGKPREFYRESWVL